MNRWPLVGGAALLCAALGTVAGNAVGSTPIYRYGAVPAAADEADWKPGRDAPLRLTPDHYPLVTGAGIVPVEELSNRGLFSQARYRSVMPAADDGPGGWEGERWEAAAVATPVAPPEPTAQDAPGAEFALAAG